VLHSPSPFGQVRVTSNEEDQNLSPRSWERLRRDRSRGPHGLSRRRRSHGSCLPCVQRSLRPNAANCDCELPTLFMWLKAPPTKTSSLVPRPCVRRTPQSNAANCDCHLPTFLRTTKSPGTIGTVSQSLNKYINIHLISFAKPGVDSPV